MRDGRAVGVPNPLPKNPHLGSCRRRLHARVPLGVGLLALVEELSRITECGCSAEQRSSAAASERLSIRARRSADMVFRAMKLQAMIFVKDMTRMLAFYRGALGFSLRADESNAEWAELDVRDGVLALHAVPRAVAATISIESPARERARTPIKPVFETADLEDAEPPDRTGRSREGTALMGSVRRGRPGRQYLPNQGR